MALTHVAIKQATPKQKPFKLFDSGNLYCLIHPNGGRYWRVDYRYQQKRKTIALGTFPIVSLKDARIRRDKIKLQLLDGIDPSAERKTAKESAQQKISFKDTALEWITRQANEWTKKHQKQLESRLRRYAFPLIGDRPCESIGALDILRVCRTAESKGHHEVAHKLRQYCGQVMRYAVANGQASYDPSADIKGALTPKVTRHFATLLQPQDIGKLLRAIDNYPTLVTRCALQLLALTFVRPGELRNATWSEIDLEERLWRIPESRMKMRRTHLVPLSEQAVIILQRLPRYTFTSLLFPGVKRRNTPISENTFNKAIRTMGFKANEFTGHGFRSMASTLLNEAGWQSDVIERQLAHVERNRARAAYNHAEYLEKRREMMQVWATTLDNLKNAKAIRNEVS